MLKIILLKKINIQMIYDIAIIGGGASGMSAAITLGSAKEKFDWANDKKIIVIDHNKSDLKAASFWNAPGINIGKDGKELIDDLHKQLNQYKNIEVICNIVTDLEKEGDIFSVKTKDEEYLSRKIIIATGLQKFNIDTSLVSILPHNKIAKKGKVMLENNNGIISENIYVSGVAAGHQTMFAIASGDGVRVACEILEEWGNDFFVPHDNAKL